MKRLYIILAHILAFIDDKAADLSSSAWAKKKVTKDKIAECIAQDNVMLVEKSRGVEVRARELQAKVEAAAEREKAAIQAKIASNEAASHKAQYI